MPRPTDQSEPPSTVPQPELNPLVNPLLGRNMGRWAEVYFTAPPEKREEAVLQLLRELGGEPPAQEVRREREEEQRQEDQRTHPQAQPEPSAVKPEPVHPPLKPATTLLCGSCGHENPQDQRFCGMCGAALTAESIPSEEEAAEERRSYFWPPEPSPREYAAREPASDRYSSSATDSYSSTDNLDHLFETQPSSSSYRVFIGGALVILLAVLGYMAWRSGQAASGLSRFAPPVAEQPAAAPTPANTEAGANASKTESPDQPAAVPDEPAAATKRAPEPVAHEAAARTTRKNPPTRPAAAKVVEKRAPNPQGNGSEELAIAQGYLSGARRNPPQAVDWLWKAIAKQNSEATILLSDLYLRGDGVPKNCDQARVLLDAAALKGRKDAGERLRHMSAFGCQ